MSIDLVKGEFDVNKFNKDFEASLEKAKEDENQREIAKLQSMNKIIYKKKISEMSLRELITEWKDSLLGILNDLLHLRLRSSELFKDNRLFFLGITILFSVLMFYLMHTILGTDRVNINKVVNEYHIISHLTEAKPEYS